MDVRMCVSKDAEMKTQSYLPIAKESLCAQQTADLQQ